MAALVFSGEQITVEYWLKEFAEKEELVINFTTLNSQSCMAFAEALKVNSSIKKLNIASTPIGDDGIFFIAEALKFNSTITTLDCCDCGITEKGAFFISEALKINTSLTVLALDHNPIGVHGAYFLIQALTVNRVIHNIKVLFCGLDDATRDGLYELLNSNLRCQAAMNFIKANKVEEMLPKIAPPLFAQAAPYNKFTSQNSDMWAARGSLSYLTDFDIVKFAKKGAYDLKASCMAVGNLFQIPPMHIEAMLAVVQGQIAQLKSVEPIKSLVKNKKVLLCDAEIGAICFFANMNQHTQDRAWDINALIRKVLEERNPAVMDQLKQYMTLLFCGLKKLPDYAGTVYRPRLTRSNLEAVFKMNANIFFPAIEFATTDLEMVKKLSGKMGCIFKMTVKHARDISMFCSTVGEQLVICPPDAGFFVRNELRVNPVDEYCYIEIVEKAGEFKW